MPHRPAPPSPPLPGSGQPVRALFVKRWGTLLEAPDARPVARFAASLFTPGAVDALFRARQAGWRVYLIGNEDHVARGRLRDEQWQRFERELLDYLAGRGVPVERCYACLDHPEGKGHHRRRSVFQLPDTGPFFHASQHDGIALETSWVVGDSTLELAAGERAGCRVAGVRTGRAMVDAELGIEPQLIGETLAEVVDALSSALQHTRH